jgi:transporter family protein
MDKINVWYISAIAALMLWGLWGFFPKITTAYINPKSALVWEAVGTAIVGIVVLTMIGFKPEAHTKGILFGVLTGVFGLLGALAFLFAVSKGKASVVVTITALYPMVVILLSYFFLHETITVKQGIGIGFALVAVLLFAG